MDNNPFSSLAAGYATARPPVHPLVIGMAARLLDLEDRVDLAIDIGCGSGLSTRPLDLLARRRVGLEPAESMLRWAGQVCPGASFVAGRAEQMPFRDRSANLLAAAGSLNYADVEAFFPEALRVLAPGGALVVYDFSQGRRFRDSGALEEWFGEFMRRYPAPASSARYLDPEVLASLARGFEPAGSERFVAGLMLDPAFYVNYMMTETNVADAVKRGTPEADIRAWCERTVPPVFGGAAREVLFEGYIACFRAPRS
jgi:ubiquinone/menaquinone biosynthesis C-methylase UbiE